jgi:DNA-binding NarL/FixJ family response regulator
VRRRKRGGRAPCRAVRLDTQGAGPDEIVAAVRVVARGEALFGAGIVARIFQHLGRAATSSPFPELTERETEVLGLLAAGRDHAGVATRLGVSPKTVHNHLSNIITKLHVSDRSEAIFRARDVGLGGAGSGELPCLLGAKKLECHHR